ncbi:MAG: ATP-binding protein [bacterium]
MLEEFFSIMNRRIKYVPLEFSRYLYKKINWDNRLIIITGARGTGKTTLVLQHYLKKYNDREKCLYLSADNPLVLKEGIYRAVAEYFKYYGECVIIDEVHKQQDWSLDIKALYDAYPDKRFIVMGSSALNILFEKGDLSRRSVLYSLKPLSFREYLEMTQMKKLPKYSFSQIIEDHVRLTGELSSLKTILGEFNKYLMTGSFPFFLDFSSEEYYNILSNVIDKVIYEDISTIKSLKSVSSLKLKKLLAFIAISKIPLFNLESLKIEVGISRDTLYEYFDLLERAELVHLVRTESRNVRAFKNSKILFKSPDLYYAIAQETWKSDIDKGNIRESFFAGQVASIHQLYSSLHADFLLHYKGKRYEIEVGGPSKKKKQIKNLNNAFIFKDGIETGITNTIPLYLAGFLY